MRSIVIAGILLAGTAGCQPGLRLSLRQDPPCAAEPAPDEAPCPPPVRRAKAARPAKVEGDCEEEVVVRVPQQKIVVETQEAKAPAPAPAAPAGYAAPPPAQTGA